MRGTDEKSGSLFSYVDLEERIPAKHPLRKIQQVVNDALATSMASLPHSMSTSAVLLSPPSG